MEFGIFLNGYLPGPAAHDSECEHEMITREGQYVVQADRFGWKYAWFGEHHSLTEYSHLSAPEVLMANVAARSAYRAGCSLRGGRLTMPDARWICSVARAQ